MSRETNSTSTSVFDSTPAARLSCSNSNVSVHRAIGHIMSSLFYPLVTFVLLAVVIAYWAVTAVYPFCWRSPVHYGFIKPLSHTLQLFPFSS